MTNWNEINCRECGNCNKKGLPSVSKGSKVCEERRGIISPERKSGWGSFLGNIQAMFAQRGLMRRSGGIKKKKDDEDEKKRDS